MIEMAALYTAGIVRNHPFVDGNKRAGFVAASFSLNSTASASWQARRMPLSPSLVSRAERSTRRPTRPGCAPTANVGETDKHRRAGDRRQRSMLPPPPAPPEHPRIVTQRLRCSRRNLLELRMLRIDQPVVLIHRQSRRHEQQTGFRPLHKLVADLGELRRRRGFPPIRRHLASLNSLPRNTVRDIRRGQYQVIRSVFRVKMNKIFQHGERLVFGSVGQARSRT